MHQLIIWHAWIIIINYMLPSIANQLLISLLINRGLHTHSCNHQNLRFTSTSFLSAMASLLKLDSMIYTDMMNIHGKFEQLRNSRKKVMDYHVMRESKIHKKWDRIERIKRNWSYNFWSWLQMCWSITYVNSMWIGSIFGYKKDNLNLKALSFIYIRVSP